MTPPLDPKKALCELCGEAMPPGEEMFKYHGYSGPCPKSTRMLGSLSIAETQELLGSDSPVSIGKIPTDPIGVRAIAQAIPKPLDDREKTRTLADYRPQHDADCDKSRYHFVEKACTCGLDALMAITRHIVEAAAMTPPRAPQQDNWLAQAIERIDNMRPKGSSPDGYVINDTLNRVHMMLEGLAAPSPDQQFRQEYGFESKETVTMNTDRMLQFFKYDHLPLPLQKVSKPFCDLAHVICGADETTGEVPIAIDAGALPRNPERTVALRKLLEAKDAAVRTILYREE